MYYQHTELINRMSRVSRRWRMTVLFRGSAMVLLCAMAVFLAAFVLDALVDLPHFVRYSILAIMIGLTLYVMFRGLIMPLMRVPSSPQLARYVEERHPGLDDRLVTAMELGARNDPKMSAELLEKLLDDTRFHIDPIDLPKTVRTASAAIWSALATAGAIAVISYMFSHLDLFSDRSNRIFMPWNIPKIDLVPRLSVTPGNIRIPKGSAQEIVAEASGFETESVFIYFANDDSSWTKIEMDETLEPGKYAFDFFDVQQETRYYVKADERLSDIFQITVYDAPRISRIDVTYQYPKYTGLEERTEIDGGDIWAPEGTLVTVRAVSDKALKSATFHLGDSEKPKTSISADTVVTASFRVTGDSFYRIVLADRDDLTNEPAPEYYIHGLPDQPPVLTLEPGRDLNATMLEEVPIRVKVQDDYGLVSLSLNYTVNGGETHSIELEPQSQKAASSDDPSFDLQEFGAEHVFYLEDMKLNPGDFLTYHVDAQDWQNTDDTSPVSSDIYFIDIRPFEQEFSRPMSQGQQQAGGPSGIGGKLSQTQKEIIVATWKTKQKQKGDSPDLESSVQVITESQRNLKEITQSTMIQIQQRSFFSGEETDEISKNYGDAIQSMEQALKSLEGRDLDQALTHEREAYQNLLRAEAQMTEVQVQQSQSGSAASNAAALDELAQLFEDEMDKLKNKYETESNDVQQQADQAVDESLEKVKELARRQQQLNQQLRDVSRQELSDEEKKRRIEELRRQQEQLRRETQELARDSQRMQQENQNFPRDVQESLRRATSEMSRASNNLNRDDAEQAAAKGQQALNRLKNLEERLQRNQNESLRRELESMEQQFQDMAERQKEITEELKQMAGSGQADQEQLQRAKQGQADLKEELAAAEEDLKSLSQKASQGRDRGARELQKFSRDLERSALEEKMEMAENMIEQERLNTAAKAGEDIEQALQSKAEELTKLRSEFAESEEEKLDLALDETRKMRENLRETQRQTEELRRGESERGQEQQSDGEQSQQQRQAGPAETKQPPQQVSPTQMDLWNEELARSLEDLDFIQNSIQSDTSLTRQARNLGANIREVLRTYRGGDPNRFREIEERILVPLKTFEAELAQKLELIKNKEKLFLARDEDIPPQYKELVEKYYEALSKTK